MSIIVKLMRIIVKKRQNMRAAIAQKVAGLGLQFRHAIHHGWLKYIKATYAAQPGEEAMGPSIGQGRVVVEDD